MMDRKRPEAIDDSDLDNVQGGIQTPEPGSIRPILESLEKYLPDDGKGAGSEPVDFVIEKMADKAEPEMMPLPTGRSK